MNLFAQIIIALIALLHIYILYMEMFAWATLGRKPFGGYSKEFFHKTKSMAANQGLLNHKSLHNDRFFPLNGQEVYTRIQL